MKTGVFLLLTAELLFALSTVFVKFVTAGTGITGIEISFFRFITGFIITSSYAAAYKQEIKAEKPFNMYMRGIFNSTSVIFFFMGVQYTTVSKTNLLNMTYPVFVFILTPLITGEKPPRNFTVFLLLVMAGIYLVAMPSGGETASLNVGDLYALMSGVTAGFGISFLREARKTDNTQSILLYMFTIGSIITGIAVFNSFTFPSGLHIFYIIIIAVMSYIGQVMLTTGYRYIDAARGSLVSSARIIFAIILGVIIFSEPLTVRIILGSILIIISLAGVNGVFKNLYIHKKR